MSDTVLLHADAIKANPIAGGLDGFRASFRSTYDTRGVRDLDAIERLTEDDLQNTTSDLLSALLVSRISRILPSCCGRKNLNTDLSQLNVDVNSNHFDFSRVKPLIRAALADDSTDALIWEQVYLAVAPSTPPRYTSIATPSTQTPWFRNTGSFANSSEYRQNIDMVLKSELGSLYVGLPGFYEVFFGQVAGLKAASEAVFRKCTHGAQPLFNSGWTAWPPDADEDAVLRWFTDISGELAKLATCYSETAVPSRRTLALPNQPLEGSTANRKLDIAFVDGIGGAPGLHCHWSKILVPGELKKNPSADTASQAWLDIGRYAREVLGAQDSRRFVLGFTLCGSSMRIWVFDRLGGIASEPFDINKDGLRFVTMILGFFRMNHTALGFDPTIFTEGNQRVVEIEKNGNKERLIIERVLYRARCVAGRATTCWKVHHEDDPQTPLLVKDSWQYAERDEEGELLKEVTDKGVNHIARYYHHETVHVGGKIDDVLQNIRGGLDVTRASNYRPVRPIFPRDTGLTSGPGESRSSLAAGKNSPFNNTGTTLTAGVKRLSSNTNLPPSKRSRSGSGSGSASTTTASNNLLQNRIHRRVILRDCGNPIWTASSQAVLLRSLAGCIEGHRSLYKAGFLHRDISINNLMINEHAMDQSRKSFLIDLDLAIRNTRDAVSGAKGITGTRAFMAIGALRGEQHSFMHDLESFFWVLLWICIHYTSPGYGRPNRVFDYWNYSTADQLSLLKSGIISDEPYLRRILTDHVTPYYATLIPCLCELRRVVFPNGKKWEQEDETLYVRMTEVLLVMASMV
ncbi:hypothetical protein F4861DRAFT_542655 [Xylaria intraflava]|nr:hypothetical protein F4861DRAFT_542655 [Xylaria intraflava]